MPMKHVQNVETMEDLGDILKDRATAPMIFFEGKPITIFTNGYYELVEGDGGVTCTLDRNTPKVVFTIEGAGSFELDDPPRPIRDPPLQDRWRQHGGAGHEGLLLWQGRQFSRHR